MYLRYKKTRIDAGTKYDCQEEGVSLFGCNNGFIPWLLQSKLKRGDSEPLKWHVDVVADLNRQDGYQDNTLVIDLKPKQNKTNISLYEVMDVWGYSEDEWTPVMLRLTGLFTDADPAMVNRQSFIRTNEEMDGPIYEFMYVDGTVIDGNIQGKWNPPPMSPTNAALLWPDTLNYFVQCIRETTPDVIQ